MLHSSTRPVKKHAPLTTRSSSVSCVLAAEHHTAEQYSKTGIKPRKNLPRSDLSWNTLEKIFNIQSLEKQLWKPSDDAAHRSSWNQMSLRIYISSSSDSVSTVKPRVNGGTGDTLCLTWRTHSQFHNSKVTTLTCLAEVRVPVTLQLWDLAGTLLCSPAANWELRLKHSTARIP